METTLKRIDDIDENVLDDIKRLVRDLNHLHHDVNDKEKRRRSAKEEKKELKRKCLLLNNILTTVARRPLSTSKDYKDSNSSATKSRTILRKIYEHIQAKRNNAQLAASSH